MEKERIKSFRDLRVYKLSFKLAEEIYEISLKFPKFELYELGSQIRKSSHSVPSCIAEGWGRKTIGQFHQFLTYASASADETTVHLDAAYSRKYILDDKYIYFTKQYEIVGKMLYNLIKAVSKEAK